MGENNKHMRQPAMTPEFSAAELSLLETQFGASAKAVETLEAKDKEALFLWLQQRIANGSEEAFVKIAAILNSPRTRKLAALQKRLESGEILDEDLGFDFIWQLESIRQEDPAQKPLQRKDLEFTTDGARKGNCLKLTCEELNALGGLEMVLPNGARFFYDPEDLSPDDVLILYPEDLGNETDA